MEDVLERFRVELTGYRYRMLGSPFEAEDALRPGAGADADLPGPPVTGWREVPR